MRHALIKWLSPVVCACTLCVSCKAEGTLAEITKPYLGEYECIRAQVGARDFLSDFSYLRLTLNADETFTLRYHYGMTGKREETGRYVYDVEQQEIILFLPYTETYQRHCTLLNGTITLTVPFGSGMLFAQFKQK